jgi:hypothetical protein
VKWSMVEPAIAITASNIATLRPLFKNSFFFARKRFDSMDDDRPSTESTYNLKGRNSVSAADYSVEFAEMLGLSRVGVTTEISAGGSQPERDHFRRRFSLSRRAYGEKSESQLKLHSVPPTPTSDGIDWSAGIKTTTTVTIDK